MDNITSLDDYKKSLLKKKEENELVYLYAQVDALMERIIEIETPPIRSDEKEIQEILNSKNFFLGPSQSALFNAYYILLEEDREDLASLVIEIIKMI